MFQELDTVVLLKNFQAFELVAGDTGTIVHAYKDGKAFEVEFVTADGTTVAVLTLEADNIRPMHKKEILHVRELVAA
jgi:ATP-dependent exoDNAse (exonuclease V) alpha subunit